MGRMELDKSKEISEGVRVNEKLAEEDIINEQTRENLIILYIYDCRLFFVAMLAKLYLFLYNFASFLGWGYILLTCIQTLQVNSFWSAHSELFPKIWEPLMIVQSLALLECVHSLVRLVRSPFITCLMQVSSRLLLVWGVLWVSADARLHYGLTLMVTSWAATEIPRYLFYSINQITSSVPFPLTWLRYSTFLILYPSGILGEIFCLLSALPSVESQQLWSVKMPNKFNFAFDYASFLRFIIYCVYPYGSFVMYSHMLKQRTKVLSGDKNKEKTN
jgi:very-long-chain (3R)-3-hydroxyacyl-CoA dehydratase